MRYTLKGYQEKASKQLLHELAHAHEIHAATGEPRAVSLQAPTGAGKTVIAASVIEALLDGDGGPEDDDNAIILWLTTDPALNAQTRTKMLAASSALVFDQLRVIENDFDARTFTPGNVYFLNTQKLARGAKLDTGGTDARTHSLWETIANTAREWGKHFYVVIDEAHVGVGGTSDRSATTITRRIIDGAGGDTAVPVVVGITATPRKFEAAMRGAGRTMRAVEVPVADVRNSGLIKDGIVLLAPGVKMKGLEYELIRRAGRRLEGYRQAWASYAARSGELDVNPAMIVQLGDIPSKAVLSATLAALRASIPGLAEDQIVHTFAEHSALSVSGWKIDHCSPELIAGETHVRVILAKSAITTGWDCPRAEVMVSLRKVEDTDLIAQIVGRTVRTPLAKRIEGDDRLNSVVAYLPFFNPAGLGAVAAALTPAADEAHAETAQAATEVTVDEVEVPDYGGEETFEDDHESMIFDEPERPGENRPSDDGVYLQDEPYTGQQPMSTGSEHQTGGTTQVLDAPAPAVALDDPSAPAGPVGPPAEQLDEGTQEELGVFREISSGAFKDLTITEPESEPEDGPIFFEIEPEFPKAALDAILALPSYRLTERTAAAATKRLMSLAVRLEHHHVAQEVQREAIEALYGQMVLYRDRMKANGTWEEAFNTAAQLTLGGRIVDANGVGERFASETSLLSSEAITERFRKAERALAEQMATNYLKLASRERPGDDWNDIRIEAIALAEDDEMKVQLENRAASFANELAEDYALRVSQLAPGPRAQIEELMAALKTVMQIPMDIKHSEQDRQKGEWLDKHVISHQGRYRYNANALEARVLAREIPACTGWYRNPSTGKDVGLGVPCVDNTGEDQILRPDFVFVYQDEDNVRIAIVDPHGGYLNDGVWKARGLAKYARDNAELIDRAVIIDEVDGQDLYLNLLDPVVAEKLEHSPDVKSIYQAHGKRHTA